MPFLRYISLIMILLPVIAFVSCSKDDSDIPGVSPDTEEPGYVQLIVSMADKQALTRADEPLWGEDYDSEDGTKSENQINSMKLFLVTQDNLIYPLEAVEAEKYSNSYRYKVELENDYLVADEMGRLYLTGRIVAVANMPDKEYADPFDLETFNIDLIKQNDGAIPMWGIVYVNKMRIYKGQTAEVRDPIIMLRSVPKVSFILHDDIKDLYIIKSVTSTNTDFERNSLCQPAGASQLKVTTALGLESCFNPALQSLKGELPERYGSGTNNVWLYTSEYECPLTDDGKSAAFEVTLARKSPDGGIEPGSEFSGTIYLCDYENGQPDFSRNFGKLVRNHDYRYIINLVELSFKISFREWAPIHKVHIELE